MTAGRVNTDAVDYALECVRLEVLAAMERFPPFNSPHEGWAVIREEDDELWEEVKSNRGRERSAYIEAKQTAAMAIRYMVELRPGAAAASPGEEATEATTYADLRGRITRGAMRGSIADPEESLPPGEEGTE